MVLSPDSSSPPDGVWGMSMNHSRRVGATAAATAVLLGGAGVALGLSSGTASASSASPVSQSLGGSAQTARHHHSPGVRAALAQLAAENAKLAAEAELLKQEIALARAEGVGGLPTTSPSPTPTASTSPAGDSGHGRHGSPDDGGWWWDDASGGGSAPAPAPTSQAPTTAPSSHVTTGASGATGGSPSGSTTAQPTRTGNNDHEKESGNDD